MKTTTLRKCILAGSLGICAMANAAPTDISFAVAIPNACSANYERQPEIRRPVIMPVPLPPLCPGPVHPIRPYPTVKPVGFDVIGCVPLPIDDKLKLLPRSFPMPDFTVRNLLSVNGNDNGCVTKPGKPTRPRRTA